MPYFISTFYHQGLLCWLQRNSKIASSHLNNCHSQSSFRIKLNMIDIFTWCNRCKQFLEIYLFNWFHGNKCSAINDTEPYFNIKKICPGMDISFIKIVQSHGCLIFIMGITILVRHLYTPGQRSWRGGILDSPCPSVRPSICPSVCRRHGFRSISQVCFGISISNFICMLMVAIGRSLLIFSNVTFKMAAWWPYWIFWFPDSNFTLALNINFKLQRHNTYVYG